MEQYKSYLKNILSNEFTGYKPNRTGVDSLSLFGPQMEFDLREGLPIVTTKKIHSKSVTHELVWMLRGDTNIKYLEDNNVRIWTEWPFENYLARHNLQEQYAPSSPEWKDKLSWFSEQIKHDVNFAKEHGDLGPVYGKPWRRWGDRLSARQTIDQIAEAIDKIKNKPTDRRILITAWNPSEVSEMALPPCHMMYQFNVQNTEEGKMLDCKLYQRSADSFLGVPFNTFQYGLLTNIISTLTQTKPRRFIHTFGDAHIYCGEGERGQFYGENLNKLKEKVKAVEQKEDYLEIKDWILKNAPKEVYGETDLRDHVPLCLEQLSREPKKLAKVQINPNISLDNICYEAISIKDYEFHPHIKGNVAV